MRAVLTAQSAHARLFKNKILHRDISMQNIVLGLPTSDSRGYLIDLDMAIDISIDRNAAGVGKDERTVSSAILYSHRIVSDPSAVRGSRG
jgi:tRNA A-37 threonylcarbamoyl transferase component Bud32